MFITQSKGRIANICEVEIQGTKVKLKSLERKIKIWNKLKVVNLGGNKHQSPKHVRWTICFLLMTSGSVLMLEFVIYTYISIWWGKGWSMAVCPFRTLVVLHRMFTFSMSLVWLMFEILFLHLSPPPPPPPPSNVLYGRRIEYRMGLLHDKLIWLYICSWGITCVTDIVFSDSVTLAIKCSLQQWTAVV